MVEYDTSSPTPSITEFSTGSEIGSPNSRRKSFGYFSGDESSVSSWKQRSYRFLGFASKEQKRVSCSKILVVLVFLAVMFGSAVATYLLVIDEEQGNFENQVTRFKEVIDVAEPAVVFSPIVQPEARDAWASFVTEEAPAWYQQSIDNEGRNYTVDDLMTKTLPYIHCYDFENDFIPTAVSRSGPVLPVWQSYPLETDPVNPLLGTNYDLLSGQQIKDLFEITSEILGPTIGITQEITSANTTVERSQIMQPIFQQVDTRAEDRTLVGVVWLQLHWIEYFQNLFVEGVEPLIVVLTSSCPKVDPLSRNTLEEVDVLSYEIQGPVATFLGEVDAHDPAYDEYVMTDVFLDLQVDPSKLPEGRCVPKLTLNVYPTKIMEDSFFSSKAITYASVVAVIFIFTSLVFLLYDYFVRRRQSKVMDRIIKQDQIVSDVFPSAIRDRLYGDQTKKDMAQDFFGAPLDLDRNASIAGDAPLADLFPSTSVVFADIAGFTAWSSAREPQQVFILLENIYGAFDKIAYRHGVFKVETVGDCYVGVAGLPEPNKKHAIVACKFARDCLKKMKETTRRLEVSLGPDTSDLDLRIGVHSGQVTAGVLRGERSRFQLFGDTMNTAARMESSGCRNRVQLSQTTADLLSKAGYSKMIEPRAEKIFVKGKGEMQSYWLRTCKIRRSSDRKRPEEALVAHMMARLDESERTYSTDDNLEDEDIRLEDKEVDEMTKTGRLVEWNVEVLSSLLQQIIASRGGSVDTIEHLSSAEERIGLGGTVLEEFTPTIPLKRLGTDEDSFKKRRRPSSIEISPEAKFQLRSYLSNIASMYHDNPFHNFEHASHVTASVKKLLKRIVNVNEGTGFGKNLTDDIDLIDLAGHSYGITSDPLTQFAVVFSAVIHDVDHPGVPNAQLVREKSRNAQIYKKSIAEQNSVELAWEMLMQSEYKELRACIYQSEEDLKRFRQLVVNTVMATDIVDRELQALRKARWETAFSETAAVEYGIGSEDTKATIVIEHLIQASDVSHTMQHWHIYRSWNEKFFMECYGAYKAGRAESDPSVNWYKGEIGFFDFYVIPLAKKLDNCGVFGVSSHEYLNYAKANREEWAREGERLVDEYLKKYEDEYREEETI
eukprot:scaffold3236_cov66-Cylindrotheca_fusiformis.AAC.33